MAWVYRGRPNALAYGPTKAALINLAETMYLDQESWGIGVSVINPGFVETPLTAGYQFTSQPYPPLLKRHAKSLSAGGSRPLRNPLPETLHAVVDGASIAGRQGRLCSHSPLDGAMSGDAFSQR